MLPVYLRFSGRPIPAKRMTQRTKWSEPAQQYLAYKGLLAQALRLRYPDAVLDIPPAILKKERAAFIKAQRKRLFEISFVAVTPEERGDVDNYLKTILDAIQEAGLLWNDKQVKKIGESYLVHSKDVEPFIEFTLTEIKPEKWAQRLIKLLGAGRILR